MRPRPSPVDFLFCACQAIRLVKIFYSTLFWTHCFSGFFVIYGKWPILDVRETFIVGALVIQHGHNVGALISFG